MQSLHDGSCDLLQGASQEHLPRTVGGTLLVMCLALGLLCGCGGSDALTVPSYSPERMAQDALAEYDANHDGYLDAKELEHCPALKAALKAVDQNGDSRLSADEIAARIRVYQDSQLALKRIACKVLLDGHPLQGATVSYVPEPFMSAAIKSATGVSNKNGEVTLIAAGEKLPGAQPGLYRVTVSKKNAGGQETIPARYNQDTTLGTEVYPGKKHRDRKAPTDEEAGIFRLSSKAK